MRLFGNNRMQTSVALSHHVDGCTSTFICTLILNKDRKVTEQTTRVRGRDKRSCSFQQGYSFRKGYSFRQGIFVPPRDIRSAKGYSFRQGIFVPPRDIRSAKRYSFRQARDIRSKRCSFQEIFVPRDVRSAKGRLFRQGTFRQGMFVSKEVSGNDKRSF